MVDDYEKEYQKFLNEKLMFEQAEHEYKADEQSFTSYMKQKAEINKYLFELRSITFLYKIINRVGKEICFFLVY